MPSDQRVRYTVSMIKRTDLLSMDHISNQDLENPGARTGSHGLVGTRFGYVHRRLQVGLEGLTHQV